MVIFLSLSLHFFLFFYIFPAESDLDIDSLIKELVKLPYYIVKDGKLQRVEGRTPFLCLHFFFFSLFVTNGGKGRTQTQVLVLPLKQPKMPGSLGAKFGMF